MKQRLLTGWTLQRVLYVLIGAIILFQFILAKQWPGIILGAYFTAMGLFGFGCAAGSCSYTPPSHKRDTP